MPIELPPKLWLPTKPAITRAAPPRKGAGFVNIFPYGAKLLGFPNATMVDSATINSSGTSFNFGTRNIGRPRGTSLVVVCAAPVKVDGATLITVSSSTIGGAAFDSSLVVQRGLVSLSVTVAQLMKSTAADSANITIVTNTTCAGVVMAVFRLNELTSITPDDNVTAANDTTSTSGVIDTTNPGILLLCSAASGATISTLSGVNTVDFGTPGTSLAAGHSQQLSTQANRAVSSTSSTANPHVLAGQTWH